MSAGTKTGNRHKPQEKGTIAPIENKHETGTLSPEEKETDPLPRQRRGPDKGALVPTKARSFDGLTAALLAPAHTGQAGQRREVDLQPRRSRTQPNHRRGNRKARTSPLERYSSPDAQSRKEKIEKLTKEIRTKEWPGRNAFPTTADQPSPRPQNFLRRSDTPPGAMSRPFSKPLATSCLRTCVGLRTGDIWKT